MQITNQNANYFGYTINKELLFSIKSIVARTSNHITPGRITSVNLYEVVS